MVESNQRPSNQLTVPMKFYRVGTTQTLQLNAFVLRYFSDSVLLILIIIVVIVILMNLNEDGNKKRIILITCQIVFVVSAVSISLEQNNHYQPTVGQLVQVRKYPYFE